MNSRQDSRRGIALVSVLLVTLVMLGLAGAFLLAHRSDLALMTSSHTREETRNACLSVAEFIEYKLQNDSTFGASSFASLADNESTESYPPSSASPLLTVIYRDDAASRRGGYRRSAVPQNIIEGELAESGVTFKITLLNNLRGDSTLSNSRGSTPGRSARVWVTATKDKLTEHIDIIFKRSPFSSSSILAGGDIDVSIDSLDGAWSLGARQPWGNSVRASRTIALRGVLDPDKTLIKFMATPGLESKLTPPYGVLQAKTFDLQDGVGGGTLNAGDERLETIKKNTKGAINFSNEAKIPDLDPSDLQSSARPVNLQGSHFAFRSASNDPAQPVTELLIDGVPVANFPLNNDNGVYDQNGRIFNYGLPGYGGGPDGGLSAVTFDLEARTMTVQGGVEIQTPQSFVLESVDRDGRPDVHNEPTLILGSSDNGSSVNAPSIDVKGSVGGQGALKTSGNDRSGDLKIKAKSYLSTTPDFGVALYSNHDVILSSPGANKNDAMPADWDALSQGFSEAGSTLKTKIDAWGTTADSARPAVAADFAATMLAGPTTPEKFDALWNGLTTELPPQNPTARNKVQAWLKPSEPAVTGPDPNWVAPSPAPVPEEPIDVDDPGPPPLPPEPPTAPIITLTPAVPAGPGVTVEKYIRLRQYLKSVKAGAPDISWLEDDARSSEVTTMLSNQLSAYQLAAGQTSIEEGGQITLKWNKLSKFFSGNNPFRSSYTPDMAFRGLVYAKNNFTFHAQSKGLYLEGALIAKGNITIEQATGAQFMYNSNLLENLFKTEEGDDSVPLQRNYWAYY